VAPELSALLVAVPEADGAVGTWRSELDRSASWGVPAHITLLYPFVVPNHIDDATIARVQRVLDAQPAFELRLVDVRWFDQDAAWLAPEDPVPLVRLTQALQDEFPEHPRYGGEHDDIVPHLTIASRGPHERMRDAVVEVGAHLPITSTVDAVTLMVGEHAPGSWTVSHRFRLVALGRS
jgi:2'-5' RNA ligase